MSNPLRNLRRATPQPKGQPDGVSTRLRDARARAAAPSQAKAKSQEPGFLRRVVDHWWDRLIGAVYTGSLSSQTARYAAHDSRLDYVMNSIGMGVWGALFPILTIVASRLARSEERRVGKECRSRWSPYH